MRVDQIMSREVVCCRPEDTLDRAAEQLWQNDCGCLPVVDAGGALRAMVTDRDICMAAFTTGRPLQEIPVQQCMSPGAVSCRADESVAEAAKVMAEHQVRRLPVVDATGRVRGLLSVNDLVRSVSRGAPATDALTAITAIARHPGDEPTPVPEATSRPASNPTAILKPAPAKKEKGAAGKKRKASTSKARTTRASGPAKKKRSKKA